MRVLASLVLMQVLIFKASGQKKLPAFGQIDVADLQMKSCPFDKEAAAMKLFDVAENDLFLFTFGETRLKIHRRTRIKVFNEKGYQSATVRIPYLNKKGMAKIKELQAIIYNLDASGKIVTQKLDKSDFFKEKLVGNLNLVNFTFPGLKPGSVVEFSYTRIERNVLQFDPWEIQDDIPIAYSAYTIISPAGSAISSKLFGNISVDSTVSLKQSNKIRVNTMYKENIPAFVPEPYMTSAKDNQFKMAFFHIPERMLMSSVLSNPARVWQFVGSFLLNSDFFGGQIKRRIPGTELIIDSANKMKTKVEKINYLFTTVKKRFAGAKEQSLNTDDISEAWKERIANSAEVNLILLNLLGQTGITGYPLLVSTRDNGLIDKTFPSIGQLNGVDVVAIVDSSKYYLLDASLENQSYDTPPLNILNREALLLRPGNIDWFLVSDERPLFKQSINISAAINEKGVLEGQATVQHYDYAKNLAIDTISDTGDEKNYSDNNSNGLKITSSEKINAENEGDPLFEVMNFEYELPATNEFLFITPHFFTQQTKSPFVNEKRITDIDFGSSQEIITSIQISIPSSYYLDEVPQNIMVRATDSSFYYKRTIANENSQILITTIFRITKSLFDKTQYEAIRDFFNKMYALHREEIVLIKKK